MAKWRIETLATGDEVVNGDVLDSNGSYVSRLLLQNGYGIARHNALPDDRQMLINGILEISQRAALCICSGGMGPTEDDLTSEVVAQVLGVKVEVNSEALSRMQARFERIGYKFTHNNLRSVSIPYGVEAFQNDVGTAPSFAVRIERCLFFFLPGVPKEFRYFVDQHVIPAVLERFPGQGTAVIQLKTLGWGESHLASLLEDYGNLYPLVKVGYRARSAEVWIKLTAEGQTRNDALEILKPAVLETERRVGLSIYGRDQDELPTILHRILTGKKLSLATAESCTGGRVAQLLTSNAGASAYFSGGVIAYSPAMKMSLLGVSQSIIENHGLVSRECAGAMATGALTRFGTDLAVATTGIAGPSGGTEHTPVGTVYMSLAFKSGQEQPVVVTLKRQFRGDRERIVQAAANTTLELVRRQILGIAALTDGVG